MVVKAVCLYRLSGIAIDPAQVRATPSCDMMSRDDMSQGRRPNFG